MAGIDADGVIVTYIVLKLWVFQERKEADSRAPLATRFSEASWLMSNAEAGPVLLAHGVCDQQLARLGIGRSVQSPSDFF
jgi:hypothetical protein